MKKAAWSDDVIVVRLDEFDRIILSVVPSLITGVGEVGVDPAADRLVPAVHPEDSERSAEFRRLASDMIDDGRAVDLAVFEASLGRAAEEVSLSVVEAESWIRVLETARLVLGARLGVGDDGWEGEESLDREDPRAIALYLIGIFQESLVDALSASL